VHIKLLHIVIINKINNSDVDCSISLKCNREFDYVTADTQGILQTFKVKRLKVKVTAWRNVSAVKSYKSGKDRLIGFKLGNNLS